MTELLDPTAEGAPQALSYAPRVASLTGKRLALVDNTKFNSDRLLQKIGDILRSQHGVGETRLWRKQTASVPIDEATIAEIRKTCDVMIAGIGD
ncbi:MAG TPA: hypothetical protein VED59_03535 [Acidimicrobiales bacterium]|nr:hypothetical protein [Acidimicrobiales bacterium]